MANPKIKFKRSGVANKTPTLSNLELGELALNTYDGKLFVRRDTSGVGIATTVSTINPWSENYGGSGISYGGNVDITGVSTFRSNVHYLDDVKLDIGDVGDLQIFHDGSHSYISDRGTGNLKFRSNAFKFTNLAETKTSLVVTPPGSVELYHNNSKKLETIGSGVTVTGDLYATTLYGDGSNLTGINAGAGGTENVSSDTIQSGIITATEQFYPPSLTSVERDGLSFNVGAFIFNETENKLQMYLGGQWKNLAFELDTYSVVGL